MKIILAIDDKKDNLTSIEAIVKLSMPECKLLTALSGEEGIKTAREKQPDTILLDIIMPQMDGYQACKKLKEDELTKHIPVIMITAIKTDPKSRIKGLDYGADAFLSKPIDPIELSAQVNVMLRIKDAEDKLRAEKAVLEEKVLDRTRKILESEKKFKYLVKNSKDLIVIIDETGKEIFVSDSVERLTGFTPEDVLNHTGFEFLHPDDVDHVSETLAKLFETPYSTLKDEYRHKTKNGGWVYLEAIGTNYLQEPLINGIVLNVRDISERKNVEKAVKISQDRYKLLSEAPVEAIFISEKGICIDQNLSAQKMFGYSLEEAIGKQSTDWIAPQSREVVWKNIMESYEEPYEVIALRKNGSTFPAEIQGKMVEIDGRAIRITALNDITQRKKSDKVQKILYNISNASNTSESLSELCKLIQKQLGKIIDTTNFYVALYDNEADTISLQYLADQMDELSTFPAGKTLTAYVIKSEKSLLANSEIMDNLGKEGKIDAFGSDSKIWLGVPLKIKGNVTGAIVVQCYENENAYDENDKSILEFASRQISIIIERKKSEETIKLTLEKAKESDRLKSAFLSTMSHELRTPLNAIIGFSEIIDRDTHIDEILDFVETINASGSHLLSLVEDIFDISLIESGEVKIQNEDVNIFSFLNNIQKIIKSEQKKMNKQNIDIHHKLIEDDSAIMVHTDSRKLSQIFLNLLKNALKFTHEGHIEYGYIKEKENDKSILKFFVKDTGIGISKEKQALIFDIFRQGDDTHTRKYEGVGIGLSVAKRLTELLGGKIWLESHDGKGSEFYFTIPLSNNSIKENKTISIETKKVNDLSGKTLLIVEDVESNYIYLKALLKKLNINILWAKTGREAISFCNDYPEIDLVFMDIKMPDLSGYEATKQIKKFRPNLPIIAQTAYALFGDDEKAENAGCDDYITKPFKKQTIFNIIDKYLI